MLLLRRSASHFLHFSTLILAVLLAVTASGRTAEAGEQAFSSVFQRFGLDLVSGLHT